MKITARPREFERLTEVLGKLGTERLSLSAKMEDGKIFLVVDHPSLYAAYQFALWDVTLPKANP